MPNFNRSASIVITEKDILNPVILPEVGPPEFIPGTPLNISGLKIVFNVKKTLSTFSNSARVDIYNLSKKAFDQIAVENDLILNAGYIDGAGEKLLFKGDIQKISREHSRTDIITKLQCDDGGLRLREIRGELSRGKKVGVMQIICEILSAFGFPPRQPVDCKNKQYGSIIDKQYLHGFSYVGSAREALSKLTERIGVEWSIQNSEAQLLLKGGVNLTPPIPVSSLNGMIGSPDSLDDVRGELSLNKRASGWKVRSLINPEIEPGGRLKIDSNTAKGEFRIEEVDHLGDTFGSDWQTIAQVTGL